MREVGSIDSYHPFEDRIESPTIHHQTSNYYCMALQRNLKELVPPRARLSRHRRSQILADPSILHTTCTCTPGSFCDLLELERC